MPTPEEIEEKIREQRTIEANKKNLVGQSGKIGLVLKMFGEPIIAQTQGGGYVDTNYIDLRNEDIVDDPKNNSEYMQSIPVMNSDDQQRPEGTEWTEMPEGIGFGVQQIGWHFDGLSRGMHMEIKYDEYTTEFTLTYKGFLAYKEIKGEIFAYVPNPEWEGWIESLCKKAKEKQRRMKEVEFENQIKNSQEQKQAWWRQMKSRWGLE
jgi:hypothetical protein